MLLLGPKGSKVCCPVTPPLTKRTKSKPLLPQEAGKRTTSFLKQLRAFEFMALLWYCVALMQGNATCDDVMCCVVFFNKKNFQLHLNLKPSLNWSIFYDDPVSSTRLWQLELVYYPTRFVWYFKLRQGFKTDFFYNFRVYLYPLKRDQHWWSNVLKTRKGRADRELVKTTSVT